MKQPATPQQVIELLAKRLEKRWRQPEAGQPVPSCKLGTEPPSRRGAGCSVCKVSQELELDQAVAHLINTSTFKRTGVCPYQVITSHLVAGLVFGPETIRGRSAGRYLVDPVVELKGALKRIGTVLQAAAVARDDIEALGEQGDRWKALNAVLSAERALGDALALFRSEACVQTRRSSRGRTGALHILAVARAIASAWRVLTGRLPAKDNAKFHSLLSAAVATIFGHPKKTPNWESATRRAVKHINKDASSRT